MYINVYQIVNASLRAHFLLNHRKGDVNYIVKV